MRKWVTGAIVLLAFSTYFSPVHASPTGVNVIRMNPATGSSQADQVVTIKTRYQHMAGRQNLTELNIWIDNIRPLAKRVFYSVHSKLALESNGVWKQYGMRYNGGNQTCGLDTEPRHCYLNYFWDVGGLNLNSGYIYANHDDKLTDTTSSTPNTIGSIKAVSVSPIDANTLEVTWEVSLGSFFADRLLEIYVSALDNQGNTLYTNDQPYWHQVGSWRVDNNKQNELFAEDFESASSLSSWSSGANPSTSNLHSYTGLKSAKVDSSYIQRDLGQNLQGVVTLYFYDDGSASNSFYVGISSADQSQFANPLTQTLAVGVNSAVSSTEYSYRGRLENVSDQSNINNDSNTWQRTGVARTVGWHKVRFWVTDIGAWAEIDDQANEISLYNLSSLAPKQIAGGRLWVSQNFGMTSFRYIRNGVLSTTSPPLFVDQIEVLTLPSFPTPLADVINRDAASRWMNYYSALWLDSYEEMGMWGNMSKWADKHCSYYQKPGCTSWLWLEIATVSTNSHIRYQHTRLPFYLDQANLTWEYLLDNAYTGWNWADESSITHASTTASQITRVLRFGGWDVLSPLLQSKTFDILTRHLDKLLSYPQTGFGNTVIGDSTAEDYAYGPLTGPVTAAIFFWGHPFAQSWIDLSRSMAMKTLSTNPNDPCPTCPGGKVGVKTIYAPGDDLQDCASDPDPIRSQNCLCKGDRAKLPANHNFSYLMDNHDYHPNPSYMRGLLGGAGVTDLIRSSNQRYGLNIPEYSEFGHNVLPVWRRVNEFYDFKKFRYISDNIYRLRQKWLCDGDNSSPYYVDRGPYNELTENAFRVQGTDSWGNLPVPNPNPPRMIARVYGQGEMNFHGVNVLDQSLKALFWRHYNYFGVPVSAGLFYNPDDLYCHWRAPHCLVGQATKLYVANRLNPAYKGWFGLEPNAQIPLRICEENIFKKRIWEGSDISWECDSQHKMAGEQSLKISSSSNTNAELYSPLIAVEPNKKYRVSYWVKSENIEGNGARLLGRVVPAQYNSSAKESTAINAQRLDAGFSHGTNQPGTVDWNYQSYTFTTLPEAKYVRLRAFLAGDGRGKGTVNFDDISLVEAKLEGDVDNNLQVNLADLLILLADFSKYGDPGFVGADINLDGRVDMFDYNWLVTNFAKGQ